MEGRVRAVVVSGKIIVPDVAEAERLYSMGFYGAPLGAPKSRPSEAGAPLLLNPLEAVYLAELGVLEVYEDGRRLGLGELRERLVSGNPRMAKLYRVYRDLRGRGLVVRPGLKFGADFAVYRHGPGIDHAPFLVNVEDPGERVDASEILRAARLSHSVRKTLTVAVERGGRVEYIMFKWFKP